MNLQVPSRQSSRSKHAALSYRNSRATKGPRPEELFLDFPWISSPFEELQSRSHPSWGQLWECNSREAMRKSETSESFTLIVLKQRCTIWNMKAASRELRVSRGNVSIFPDGKARTGSHWNAHRLSIWNRLLPALHRPPSRTVNQLSAAQLKAHQLHQLLEDSDKASSFAGNVRNMTFFAARSEPSLEAPTTALAPTVKLISNGTSHAPAGVNPTL